MQLVMFGAQPLAAGAFLSWEGGHDAFLIDATRLTFACPLDLAGMVATANWAAAMGMPVTLKLPWDAGAATYLQRMNVLALMPDRIRVVGRVLPDERANRAHRLLEVTQLTNAGQGDAVADQVGHLLSAHYSDFSEAAGRAVWRACGELIANAVEHGMSETGAFVAAQTYTGQSSTGGSRFEFAICDTGVGVLAHLKQNVKYHLLNRDCIAIQKAMEPGVSGVGDDRGNGLSDLMEHTRRYGPIEFQMRSGTGEVKVVGSPSKVFASPGDRQDTTSGTWAWLVHQPQ